MPRRISSGLYTNVYPGASRPSSIPAPEPATTAPTSTPASLDYEQPGWVDWLSKGSKALGWLNKGRQAYQLGSQLAGAGSLAEAGSMIGSMAAQAGPMVVAGLIAKKLMEPNVDNYWMRVTTGDTDTVNPANQPRAMLTKDDYINIMQQELEESFVREQLASNAEAPLGAMFAPKYEYQEGDFEAFMANQQDGMSALNTMTRRTNGLGEELDGYEQISFEKLRDQYGMSLATEYSAKDAAVDPLHSAESPFGKITLSGWTDLGAEYRDLGVKVADLMSNLDNAIARRISQDDLERVQKALNGLDQQTSKWSDRKAPTSSLNGMLRDRYQIVAQTLGDDYLERFSELTDNDASVTDAIIEMLGGPDAVRDSIYDPGTPRLVGLESGDRMIRL